MAPDDAAKKWVEDNPDKVDAWLRAEPAPTDPATRAVRPSCLVDRRGGGDACWRLSHMTHCVA